MATVTITLLICKCHYYEWMDTLSIMNTLWDIWNDISSKSARSSLAPLQQEHTTQHIFIYSLKFIPVVNAKGGMALRLTNICSSSSQDIPLLTRNGTMIGNILLRETQGLICTFEKEVIRVYFT